METKILSLIALLTLMCVMASCRPYRVKNNDISTLKSLSSLQQHKHALKQSPTATAQTAKNINYFTPLYFSIFFVIILILIMFIFRRKLKNMLSSNGEVKK